MILIIDNYDSFTYNLVQYIGELGKSLKVFRNDKISVDKIKKLRPEKIVISPGPGRPQDAGVSKEVILKFSASIPILGVCLGHQCIAEAYGGDVVPADSLMHGKTSLIYHNAKGIFQNLPNPFEATRYHSLVVKRSTLPGCLEVTAWTKTKEVMGLGHKKYPVFGVQFHPESILTQSGKDLIRNFLKH